MKRTFFAGFWPVPVFTVIAFLVMGYHPGAEDDGIYLAAVKADVTPGLFPHDWGFFALQMRTSVFDNWMAAFIHSTGISVAWAEFLWQAISVLLIVWACWTILCRLTPNRLERLGGIALFASMLTIPVAGTALYIADQYLHPRNPATGLILLAVSRILAGRRWQAVPLLLGAFILHPLMGTLGVSFCFFLTLVFFEPLQVQIRSLRARLVAQTAADIATPVAALIPFTWIFDPPSQLWLNAVGTRHSYWLYHWTWYEWLGAIGPLILFWVALRLARKQGETTLARFLSAILVYGVFQQTFAMIVLGPRSLVGCTTLEPMRYLQLVYVFMTLIGGMYIARYLLKARVWRWALFLLLANGGMYFAQRQLFAENAHVELPGARTSNPWLQAFDWVRQNTPTDAYFALDPYYMNAPQENNHSFRALAERSVLADAVKDTAVITKVPELGPVWVRQTEAQRGWSNFQAADFERLKSGFGVNWVLVRYPQPDGLDCQWHNNLLAACRIP